MFIHKPLPLALKRAKSALTATRASQRAAILAKKRGTAANQQSASDEFTPEKLQDPGEEDALNITLGVSSPSPPPSTPSPAPASSTPPRLPSPAATTLIPHHHRRCRCLHDSQATTDTLYAKRVFIAIMIFVTVVACAATRVGPRVRKLS